MNSAATRGQARALAEVDSMILGQAPHSVLLVGPGSVGKTTLALDLAAGLLCNNPDPAARPCRACRGCRQVASGNHPDLHRLAPEGPGGQIRIGKAGDPEPGTVRHIIGELSLLPVEGGARVVIVEGAHRLNEDAQNAFLKMLEEPPAGVTIILCADDEECLLPTVRSRCVRIRLGAVGGREIEHWLGELGVADAPRAARLARLAEGRPGLALAYARSVDAERLRGEMARGILDMLAAPRQKRLAVVRELMKSAAALDAALDAGRGIVSVAGDGARPRGGRGAKGKATKGKTAQGAELVADSAAGGTAGGLASGGDAAGADPAAGGDDAGAGAAADAVPAKLAAADRRSAAATLIGVWASVARDIAVAAAGGAGQIREIALLDELPVLAPAVSAATLATFLGQLAEIAIQLDDNVNPELALDVLALSWPHVEPAAARSTVGAGSAATAAGPRRGPGSDSAPPSR
jgi:DNA polymerase-3 subunit delta'